MPPLICKLSARSNRAPSLIGSPLPLALGALDATWVVGLDMSLEDPRDCRGPGMKTGREGGLTGGQEEGLQFSVSFPSPYSSLAVADLEQELHDSIMAKHGDKVPYVYFNKGL